MAMKILSHKERDRLRKNAMELHKHNANECYDIHIAYNDYVDIFKNSKLVQNNLYIDYEAFKKKCTIFFPKRTRGKPWQLAMCYRWLD